MSTTSTPINLTITATSPGVTMSVVPNYTETRGEYLQIEGNIVNLFYQNPGAVLDPPILPEADNIPPLPDYLLVNYWDDLNIWNDVELWIDTRKNNPFIHLTLGRLQNKPAKVFNLNIYKTLVSIDGVDYSNALFGLDWATPINGVAQGSITLKETVGIQLNPEVNGIKQGSNVYIRVKETPSSSEDLVNCFVVGSPSLTLNAQGTYELVIQIGDELALLGATTRNRTKYCGPVPTTTQQLANVYASINGLRTRVFPMGHDILEASTNSFITETPFELLSKIYDPVNRDVRTNRLGLITVQPRRPFIDSQAHRISHTDVIQSQNSFSGFYEPYTTVKASNDFTVTLPFELQYRSFTQVNGNPENRKPWFQGGYQEIKTTVATLGDTDIWKKVETFGYVPTESTPWDKTLVDEDPCAIGGFTTVFDVIETVVTASTYFNHPSGVKIIFRKETWKNGLKVFQIKDELDPNFEDYDLYNGILEYTLNTRQHSSQVNLNVCERDYQILVVNNRTEKYSVDDEFNFVFNSWEQETYSSSGLSSTLGQTSYTGTEQRWTRNFTTGEFDRESQIWVIQPSLIEPNSNPPSAEVVKPATENITNFSQFTLSTDGNLEPKPLSAPFCYNKQQLDTVSERYLREQYGLSKAVTITLPYSSNIALGDSVYYTDRLGQTNKYLVWDLEVNQTLNQVTKTMNLLRYFDAN